MEEKKVVTSEEEVVEETEEKEKIKLSEWVKMHPRAVFWIRFAFWTIFAAIIPFLFIALRFKLFKAMSEYQLSGWGIFGIIILVVFVFTILRYVRIALSAKYTLVGQCLEGFTRVIIPLLILLLVVNSMRNNVDVFIKALSCVIICEAIAIPINPLPKWVYEKQKDVAVEERKDTVDYLLSGLGKLKDKDKK